MTKEELALYLREVEAMLRAAAETIEEYLPHTHPDESADQLIGDLYKTADEIVDVVMEEWAD